MAKVPFIGQAYDSVTSAASTQESINLMLRTMPGDTTSPAILVTTAGVKDFGTVGTVPGERGLI